MAASAEVDALPAFRDAGGVSRCEVDLSLLRALWQQHRVTAASVGTAASFFSAHRPRPAHPTTNRCHVDDDTCACGGLERSVLRKCGCRRRWQESCLSSAALRSLRVWRDTSDKRTA